MILQKGLVIIQEPCYNYQASRWKDITKKFLLTFI